MTNLAPDPKYATLVEMLSAAAASGAELTFLDAREQVAVFPWSQLRERAMGVAAGLVALGIERGDRVAIVLPTGPEFCDAFFGASLAGAVPVPLYPPVRLGRLSEYHRSTARMIQSVGARIVLTDSRVRLLLGAIAEMARPPLGIRKVEELRSSSRGVERDGDANAIAMIQFSSGSTVDPKPVALTHRHLLVQCATLKALFPEQTHVPLGVSWLPLYHDMGLIGALLQSAFYPGPLTLIGPELFLARPAIWLRTISRFRATISPAPNFAYALCLKRISDNDISGIDLSSWTYAVNGAEPVSTELMARFSERFARFGFRAESLMPVYGLSEASLAVTFSPRRAPALELAVDADALARSGEVKPGHRRLASVGVPVPGVDVEVRSEAGERCAPRRVGRIFVRGPSVMAGYFGNPEATARALVDGWLDTGDLGFFDEGELYVCGRAKDLVIVRGANHAPQEFEDCLEGLEGLRAGCAVALGFVPEGEHEESLLVLAEVTGPPSAALEERVKVAIVSRTGIKPHTVKMLEAGTLPRTSSGKMRRTEALRQFLAGELAPPSPVNAVRMVGAVAQSTLGFVRAKLSR